MWYLIFDIWYLIFDILNLIFDQGGKIRGSSVRSFNWAKEHRLLEGGLCWVPGLLLVCPLGNHHHDHQDEGGDKDEDDDDGTAGVFGRGGSCLKPFPPGFHSPGCFFFPTFQLSLSLHFSCTWVLQQVWPWQLLPQYSYLRLELMSAPRSVATCLVMILSGFVVETFSETISSGIVVETLS